MIDEHTAKLLSAIAVIGGLAFSGWNLYLQSKLREIGKLWSWKDSFEEKYNEHRVDMAKEFATKSELREAFDRIDHHLEDIRRSVDRLRDRLEPRKDD